MEQLRPVSKTEKIIFPVMVTIVVSLLLPSAAPLVGMLMLGNLFRVCLVADRLSDTAQNALMNIVTIFLGVTVGATASAEVFLAWSTIKIMLLGVIAFSFGTAGGVLFAKLMCKVSGGKINPKNFLLMHAMGPNVAGVIGSAIAAGVLLSLFGMA